MQTTKSPDLTKSTESTESATSTEFDGIHGIGGIDGIDGIHGIHEINGIHGIQCDSKFAEKHAVKPARRTCSEISETAKIMHFRQEIVGFVYLTKFTIYYNGEAFGFAEYNL